MIAHAQNFPYVFDSSDHFYVISNITLSFIAFIEHILIKFYAFPCDSSTIVFILVPYFTLPKDMTSKIYL